MMTLGLSDGGLSDDLSDGIVIKSEWTEGTLPRGLVILTLRLAAGVDSNEGDLGGCTCTGEICGMA